MVNTNEIKAQLKRTGLTQVELAKKISMDPSTLNRKINNSEGEILTVKEAEKIAQTLSIPKNLWVDIFFASQLANTQV